MSGRLTNPEIWVGAGLVSDQALYSAEEFEFLKAMDKYKRDKRRPFPTCCEVLRSLGYRKVKE